MAGHFGGITMILVNLVRRVYRVYKGGRGKMASGVEIRRSAH
jgi:hypothetical protein